VRDHLSCADREDHQSAGGRAVGCILALINVLWAWFGVNLFSVGLHSYGFTSGIANALILYVVIEILFISATVLILGQKNIKF
jgi:hypothetical protein